MNITQKRGRGRPSLSHPKTLQFNIRMSEPKRAELDELCRLAGRPLSYQLEHLIEIAKMTIDFCDGNDNLLCIQERLAKAKRLL